jgi:uncharacterized protein
MTPYFLDTSAIVKRFIKESGSIWVTGLLRHSAKNLLYVSSLSEVEVISALARRRKGLTISVSSANKSIERFQKNFEKRFLIVEANVEVLKPATVLADSHELRGYDAVQLASAIEANQNRKNNGLSELIFVSADNELNSAAQAEGLQIENPNNYP